MTENERLGREVAIYKAVETAIRDWFSGQGEYYSGPMAGIYVRTIGLLQTEQVRREEAQGR